MRNLYSHFPFCRTKCSYCSLYSRVGVSVTDRDAYVRSLADQIARFIPPDAPLQTIYFGGGSPALCDLSILAPVLHPFVSRASASSSAFEFTVELHPHDVTSEKLAQLKALGVNRLSMGVQSFDDATLQRMGRGYTRADAARAFVLAKKSFENVGIDLIVGYPGDEMSGTIWRDGLRCFAEAGLTHCSVYSLQNERGLTNVPDDDLVLNRLREVADELCALGLGRYEISNYARPGFECRHNLAVWRGEDYVGLGEGAYGREGLNRTVGRVSGRSVSTVTPDEDLKERTLFRLRTREGLDASHFPHWLPTLEKYVEEGLLTREDHVFYLTDRGREVCDSILVDLI